MNFSEKLNILFKDSGQTAAIVDGESFVLKSLPGTTNITLLDPNDDLYIDTDYDGTYEDNTLNIHLMKLDLSLNLGQTQHMSFIHTKLMELN